MISKQELSEALWPDVHVSERNLTNLIVSLRKILGRNAIRTVSKHGYRFELAVSGEPGVRRQTYEKFMRARELTTQRSLESMILLDFAGHWQSNPCYERFRDQRDRKVAGTSSGTA